MEDTIRIYTHSLIDGSCFGLEIFTSKSADVGYYSDQLEHA